MPDVYVMMAGLKRGGNGNGAPEKGDRPQGRWLGIFPTPLVTDFGLSPRNSNMAIVRIDEFPYEIAEVLGQCISVNEDDRSPHFRFVSDIPALLGSFNTADNARFAKMLSAAETIIPDDIVSADWETHFKSRTTDNGGPMVEVFDTEEVLDEEGNSFDPPVFQDVPFDPPQYVQAPPAAGL